MNHSLKEIHFIYLFFQKHAVRIPGIDLFRGEKTKRTVIMYADGSSGTGDSADNTPHSECSLQNVARLDAFPFN